MQQNTTMRDAQLSSDDPDYNIVYPDDQVVVGKLSLLILAS